MRAELFPRVAEEPSDAAFVYNALSLREQAHGEGE